MRREFDEEDEPKKSTRGKKNNQKMKPFLVYQYLMRHTDENHVIREDDICLAMADIYGIDAERRGIYRDIDEINKAILAFEEGISIEEAAEWIEDDESLKNIIFDLSLNILPRFAVPDFSEDIAEILGKLAFKLHILIGYGVDKAYLPCVETLTV